MLLMESMSDIHLRFVHNKGGGFGPGGAWNDAWIEFRNANYNASPDEIRSHAEYLLREFGLR